jgi:hypothetical protein
VRRLALLVALAAAAAPGPLSAQDAPERHGLWIGLGFGGGRVAYWSDQSATVRRATLTASLQGGVVVVPALRLGIEANGWGLQPSSFNDPAKGETVNELLLIARFYPWPSKGAFVKGGFGWGEYHNKQPQSWGSTAFGAFVAGVGYEMRLARNVYVTLAADLARGPMGSVNNLVVTSTGRRFHAWSLVAGIQWH